MANEIKYPEGKYSIVNVGPSRNWSFKGDGGEDIQMVSYSLQLEGVAEWVDLGQKPETPAPLTGDELEGHIEDTGKFGFKFVKKRAAGGGGRWSGGKNSPGAAFANAVQSSTEIVMGFYKVTGTKPASPDEVLERIEAIAPKVKAMVDRLAGTETKDEVPAQTQSQPAPITQGNPNDQIVIDNIDEKELKW